MILQLKRAECRSKTSCIIKRFRSAFSPFELQNYTPHFQQDADSPGSAGLQLRSPGAPDEVPPPEGDARPLVGCHALSVSSRRTSGAAAVETTGGHASGEAVGFPDDGGIDKVMCLFRKGLYLRHAWYSRCRRSKSCARTTSFAVSLRA